MPFASCHSGARAVAGALILVVFGCQPAVREDRTITFGPDGRASFQHGRNGVFVTDPTTGAPKRVYEPAPGDLAFSPPAWDPAGKRMAFAVARPLDGERAAPAGDAPADGRWYPGVPVRYTCWLYDPAAPGGPEKLFEAAAGHAGYVAAGLAVAWHPDGTGLDLVDRHGEKQHAVHSYDLAARRKSAVALPAADHVALGSAPGRPRHAVLGGALPGSGLWVEGGGTWWRVPDSEPDAPHLESLRRRLPRWSRDGAKLAFVAGDSVRVCDVAARRTQTWFRSERRWGDDGFHTPEPSAGLHWHPDGTRVGLIDAGRLVTIDSAGKVAALVGTGRPVVPVPPAAAPVVDAIVNGLLGARESVMAFAGWDAGGRRMAYIATEPLPYRAGTVWATLFVPNPNARTAVLVADADGANPKSVVGGLRATFPHWSPTGSRLSVWLTVEPPYRLADGRTGMPPGDPAALIDADTGKLEWLPVNGTEHAQVGHAELRAGRLDAALRRFDDATAALPAGAKADWMLFRAVALQKAGRGDEARLAWARFEPPAERDREGERALISLMRATNPSGPWADADAVRARHRFAAEAFVSLELADEGIEFLRREVLAAVTDADRLSAAVALCQMLLLADRKEEYATCVADHLLPLAARVLASPTENPGGAAAVAWTILPLAVGEFAAALPEELVRRVGTALTAWTSPATDADLARQLVLRACGRRLNDDTIVRQASERLAAHPSQAWWKPADGEVDAALLLRLRFAFLIQDRLIEQFVQGAGGESR